MNEKEKCPSCQRELVTINGVQIPCVCTTEIKLPDLPKDQWDDKCKTCKGSGTVLTWGVSPEQCPDCNQIPL